jgi:hypothetical protein
MKLMLPVRGLPLLSVAANTELGPQELVDASIRLMREKARP